MVTHAADPVPPIQPGRPAAPGHGDVLAPAVQRAVVSPHEAPGQALATAGDNPAPPAAAPAQAPAPGQSAAARPALDSGPAPVVQRAATVPPVPAATPERGLFLPLHEPSAQASTGVAPTPPPRPGLAPPLSSGRPETGGPGPVPAVRLAPPLASGRPVPFAPATAGGSVMEPVSVQRASAAVPGQASTGAAASPPMAGLAPPLPSGRPAPGKPVPVHVPGPTPRPAVRLTPPAFAPAPIPGPVQAPFPTPTPAAQRAPKAGPVRVHAPDHPLPHAPQLPIPAPAPPSFPPTAAAPPSVQRTPHTEPPPPYSPPSPSTPTTPIPTTGEPPPAYTPVDFDARALTGAQVDELTHRLIGPLTRLLRTELRLDRERIGRLRDPRN